MSANFWVYFLYPVLDFLGECFASYNILFRSFFFLSLGIVTLIGVISIVRRLSFDALRRDI